MHSKVKLLLECDLYTKVDLPTFNYGESIITFFEPLIGRTIEDLVHVISNRHAHFMDHIECQLRGT